MITTNGRNIVAKYLLNQAPEFASHIAIGVGGKALPTSSSVTFANDANSLGFEVARVPILSKGLLKENDNEGNPVEKIVFKAELPIEQRYQITEIGLYPANNNAVAQSYDSKILATFNNTEPWNYSNNQNVSGVIQYTGPVKVDFVNIGSIDTAETLDFSFIDNNSAIFEYSERMNRGESPRYLNRSLMVVGDSSVMGAGSASVSVINTASAASYYVQNNSINLNLGKNLPTDQVKFAFSVVSKARADVPALAPKFIKIRLELLNNSSENPPKAYVDLALVGTSIEDMRYQVVTKSLSEFTTTTNFSWSAINAIRIYSCLHDDSVNKVPSPDHYIIYDGIRFENISSYNPLYALVAAEYIKTQDENPISKKENSTSYIEYRFGIGIGPN